MIKILVIDDEQSVADALRVILEDCGYLVSSAATGREGLALAQQHSFAVTITDYGLPDITGVDVIHAVLQANPHSSVILITANCAPELTAEAKACGVFEILKKPFLPTDITTMLTKLLSTRVMQAEPCRCRRVSR